MQHSERFNRAVQALVSAYLGGTLAKGSYCGCAVGNVVAASIGTKVIPEGTNFTWQNEYISPSWDKVFCTYDWCSEQCQDILEYTGEAKRQIDATGYSWLELAAVESAFEKATKIRGCDYRHFDANKVDADQLAGLHAVIDVLCDIEGITDPSATKALFAKPLAEAGV